ncbi:MAG: Rha family transcriptional regulator [Peptoanaerobacter stomatis]|uniref:Rha family transcriptional regulator n=1 Tax=Peptoanaerobacter stomatis TaxID=796937 RepID=UPI003FA0E87C
MQELQVLNLKNDITLDSRIVAEMLSKKHSDLLRDIETYIQYFSENADLRSQEFFVKSSYKTVGNNKTYKSYQITKKGCEFLAHKLTGQKGSIFTAKYINAFESLKNDKIANNEQLIQMIAISQQNMMNMINTLSKTVDKLSTIHTASNKISEVEKDSEIDKLIKEQGKRQTLKILTLPKNIIDIVDELLSSENRNFSYISRYLYDKGYNVSNAAISKYYHKIFKEVN